MWLMSNEDADIEQQIKDLEEENASVPEKDVSEEGNTNPKESKEKDEAKEETYWQ